MRNRPKAPLAPATRIRTSVPSLQSRRAACEPNAGVAISKSPSAIQSIVPACHPMRSRRRVRPGSMCGRAGAPARRFARQLALDYELIYVEIPRRGTGSPDPANPHPDKRVPALTHDGHLITESAAILGHQICRAGEARAGRAPPGLTPPADPQGAPLTDTEPASEIH